MNTPLTATAHEFQIGSLHDIPLGEGRAFVVEHHSIAVFRSRDGALYAVRNACPHAGGPLSEGILGANTVICPLHSYKFNLESRSCHTDPSLQLQTYPVRAAGDLLYVTLDG